MAIQTSAARFALVSGALALVTATACTHDFTGYRLEATGGAGGAAPSLAGDTGVSVGSTTAANGGTSSAGHAGESSANAGSAGMIDTANAGTAGSDDPPQAAAPPSCDGLPSTCSFTHTASCCAASLVPGGSYARSDQTGATATVSDFSLDDYEVSVGRFRKFAAAFTPTMTPAGAGKNPSNADLDPGWNSAWNAKLPASAAALVTAVQCSNGTFTTAPGANEVEPVTCVSWYEAFAFCIWDGGRLPTEAEWNYAAAGGTEERTYPWGSTVPDDALAVFCPGSCGKVQGVGSKAPLGNGKWGQADLVGNAWEWNLDVFANPYPQASCNDCANTSTASGSDRVFRGGSAGNDGTFLLSASRYSRDPSDHNGFVGMRCARKP